MCWLNESDLRPGPRLAFISDTEFDGHASADWRFLRRLPIPADIVTSFNNSRTPHVEGLNVGVATGTELGRLRKVIASSLEEYPRLAEAH